MSIVVLGSHGQLGHDLVPRLTALGEVIALARADVDLTDAVALRAILAHHRPTLVVNCAAYNQVDAAEGDPEPAFCVNAIAVGALAKICCDLSTALVHFSTDYVFGLDEQRTTPYKTSDPTGPLSAYGQTKAIGEQRVRRHCSEHLILRTCGLYGLHGVGGKGTNFVETMLRLASQGKPLRVVADQICTPSYTEDVAEATVALLRVGAHGMQHVVNSGSCSWYEFARAIFELTDVEANLTPITSAEYGARARRPAYSVLDLSELSALGIATPRPWREALAAYLAARPHRR